MLWHCMRGWCIDLPRMLLHGFYTAAGLPTTANEQSISVRCLWGWTLVLKIILQFGHLSPSPIPPIVLTMANQRTFQLVQ